MAYFAVIDTETNWDNRVMSVGTVIADTESFLPAAAKYHVLSPEYQVGGMFSSTLFPDMRLNPMIGSRAEVLEDVHGFLSSFGINCLFAYNAAFDRKHLPELADYCWYDIMRLAAYRQYNPYLPDTMEFCCSGRLKRGYGVEPILRILSGDLCYHETHNALYDAMDELKIMQLLQCGIDAYVPL